MKNGGDNKLFPKLVIIDELANDPKFIRQSKILHALYIRGRRNMINTIAATQKFNAIHAIIRDLQSFSCLGGGT